MPQLAATDLVKTFDNGETVAVDDITFNVEPNEIVALLGPSGCGKTTTLRSIAGVETPDSGQIDIGGNTVFDSDANINLNPEDRDVGMVYQNYAIWPHKSVYENIVFPLKYKTDLDDEQTQEERVMETMRMLQIDQLRDKPATDLSGGQQQRVALARSIVHDPSLLLLDEPLSNLDKKLRTEMRDELQRIQAQIGISMLYVTHDQDEAFYLADRVMIMNHGDIVEIGTPAELQTGPEQMFSREFIGSWNKLTGHLDNGTLQIEGLGNIDSSMLSDRFNELDGDVTLFIHPKNVQIDREEDPEGEYVTNTGTVVAEGVVGDHYEISVEFEEGKILKVHHDEFADLPRGDPVTVNLNPNTIVGYN